MFKLPSLPNLPEAFANAEQWLAHEANVAETFLKDRSLPTLKKLETWLESAKSLPHDLEPFRDEIAAFLSRVITDAEDLAAIAAMIAAFTASRAVAAASGIDPVAAKASLAS